MTWITVGDIDDFPDGKGTSVSIDNLEIAIFNIEGELYAIQNLCAHKNLPIHLAGHDKFNPEDENDVLGAVNKDELAINCPYHGLKWDLESGCNRRTGKCVSTFQVESTEDGAVEVLL